MESLDCTCMHNLPKHHPSCPGANKEMELVTDTKVYNEMIEIITQLAERDTCNCDGEYINGIAHTKECLECRAKRFLDEVEK